MFRERYSNIEQPIDIINIPYTEYANNSVEYGYGPFYRVYSQLAFNESRTNWANTEYYFRPFKLNTPERYTNTSDRYKVITMGLGADLECRELTSKKMNDSAGLENIESAGELGMTEEGSIVPSITIVNTPNGTVGPPGSGISSGGVCLSTFSQLDATPYANLSHPKGTLISLYAWPDWTPMIDYNPWGDKDNTCPDSFPFMAVSATYTVSPRNKTAISSGKTAAEICTPVINSGLFELTVSPSGNVYSAVPSGEVRPLPTTTNITAWRKKINAAIQLGNSFFPRQNSNGPRYLDRRRADTYSATNWALILGALNSSSVLDVTKWDVNALPKPEAVASELQSLYRHLFVEYMALDPFSTLQIMDSLTPAESASRPFTGSKTNSQRRVQVSESSYIISIIILIFFLFTLGAVYIRPMDRGLAFVPTTLGATLAFVSDSEALEDVKGTSGMTTREREEHLKALGHKYYVGWGDSPAPGGRGTIRRYGLHREDWRPNDDLIQQRVSSAYSEGVSPISTE